MVKEKKTKGRAKRNQVDIEEIKLNIKCKEIKREIQMKEENVRESLMEMKFRKREETTQNLDDIESRGASIE